MVDSTSEHSATPPRRATDAARIAQLESELDAARRQLVDADRSALTTRGREIFARSLNKALAAAYDVVADASQEIEAYRREVETDLDDRLAGARAELARLQGELADHEAAIERAQATLERERLALGRERELAASELRAERERWDAERSRMDELAETERRAADQRFRERAEQQLAEDRARFEEWTRAVLVTVEADRRAISTERANMAEAVRVELESARLRMERQLTEERARLAALEEGLEVEARANAERSRAGISAESAGIRRAPDDRGGEEPDRDPSRRSYDDRDLGSDEAFERFFASDHEEEPSRSWILSGE